MRTNAKDDEIKISVNIFTLDRFYHVELCLRWLYNSPDVEGYDFEFSAIDDGSKDSRMLGFLENHSDKLYVPMDKETTDPDARIGKRRQEAIDRFLKNKDFSTSDYVMLLDSDVIITKQTITDAIKDYEMLSETQNIGGATLHALGHVGDIQIIDDKGFANVTLTGDAHMFFRKDHLQKVGNHFGGHYKGFADTQIQEITKAGMVYWTKVSPPYQVQHIGIGEGGTTIYKDKAKRPPWTMRPYWTHVSPRRIVRVQGFDVLQYADIVNKIGGAEAPHYYLRTKGVPHEGTG